MKKAIVVITCLVILFLVPIKTLAQSYELNDTDITISIPDDWFVFTRENIKDNEELKMLQIDYEYMKNMFESSFAYMDAFIIDDTGVGMELFVRVKENDAINNLSDYSNDEVLEFAEGLAKKSGSKDYDIYVEDYKYAVSKYVQQELHIIEYYTIVNGYGYTITVQKNVDYTALEEKQIKDIVDTIVFDVDETLKESSSIWDNITIWALEGGLVGILSGLVGALTVAVKNKKKKNNKENV